MISPNLQIFNTGVGISLWSQTKLMAASLPCNCTLGQHISHISQLLFGRRALSAPDQSSFINIGDMTHC